MVACTSDLHDQNSGYGYLPLDILLLNNSVFTMMKRILVLTLFIVGNLLAQASKVELVDLTKNPSKYVGKSIELKGMVYSACPKSDKRIFVSPENDKAVRLEVILKKGSAASYRGKAVTVKGILKKAAFVDPKPCGRCDGVECAKSVSDGSEATYYVEATEVK